jgi:hypothetical protein
MLCNQQRRANSEWFFIFFAGGGGAEKCSWYNMHHVPECYILRSREQELSPSNEHFIVGCIALPHGGTKTSY